MIEIFDGAMGTMLQEAGLKVGECPELYNLEHPEVVEKIHRAYVENGATIIETNTFGATCLKLAHYGLEKKVREINIAAATIAKKAAGSKAKVAGSIGPSGRFISPLGDLDFEDAYEAFYEQAKALADGGVDYIIIETIIDLQEMRAALLAVKEATKLPVICQLSYSEDSRTVTGTSPTVAAIVLDAMGADVIGMNCSLGPKQLLPLIEEMTKVTNKPISVQPNAGMPRLENGKTIFPMTADDFGKWAPRLVEAGASYVGGCCGTTPAHIAKIAESVKDLEQKERPRLKPCLRLASRSEVVEIDKDLKTVLIGERINPTGRKKLATEIKEGSLLTVKKDALDQIRAGARVLDVNMGVAGIDQKEAMKRAVVELSQLVSTPLAIDTSDKDTLEAGLRLYPGRALINSVSAEKERLEEFLPLAKKYGAAILCLPITADGVPKTAQERLSAIDTIVESAKEYGLGEGDFLLDALVLTVAADEKACLETLNTLRLYREKYGYPSTMGLSNISFGLPNRPLLNSTFFSMCLAFGLDAPIMNPYDEKMQSSLMASAALLGHDKNGREYSQNDENLAVPKGAATAKITEMDPLSAIKAAVISGEKEMIVSLVDTAIEKGHTSIEITEKSLTAAMNEIGIDFGAGRVFLPQVLLAAEAMRTAFLRIRELLPAQNEKSLATVVMATVKGDVHDLGKNIVSALLENNGFRIIDLGKDVEAEEIVKTAKEENAELVGLCALMTTTMSEIDKVVASLKEAGVNARVIAGGAAVTEEYAKNAGCDAYASDGVVAVQIARSLVEKG